MRHQLHHSFLPAFAGARPYHQAQQRGVKVIGATAHYVTADWTKAPSSSRTCAESLIAITVEDMMRKGRELERQVLTRAVRLHLQRRVPGVWQPHHRVWLTRNAGLDDNLRLASSERRNPHEDLLVAVVLLATTSASAASKKANKEAAPARPIQHSRGQEPRRKVWVVSDPIPGVEGDGLRNGWPRTACQRRDRS